MVLHPHISPDIHPSLIQETTDYNLKNANDFRTLQANTHLYFNSLFSFDDSCME